MKIIVTGSLGHIGKPLTIELVQKGYTVTVISSKPEKQKDIEALGAISAIGTVEDVEIASVGTILLIGLYAKSHFRSWKSAGIFSGVLSLLYGFIFILIRLEDTALLVGSIGLFIILALTMYDSKKVNWYVQTEEVVLQ